MKKQTMKTKLSLNKFKIANISDLGKSKIFGGTNGVGDNGDTSGPDIQKKSKDIDDDGKCKDIIR